MEHSTPPPYTSPRDDVRSTQSPSHAFHRKLSATSSNFSPSHSQSIFRRLDAALKSYKKQTKRNLIAHPLVSRLLECDSPEDILAVLQNQAAKFGSSWGGNEKLRSWLSPVVNVLYPFSTILGEGVSPVSITSLCLISRPDLDSTETLPRYSAFCWRWYPLGE